MEAAWAISRYALMTTIPESLVTAPVIFTDRGASAELRPTLRSIDVCMPSRTKSDREGVVNRMRVEYPAVVVTVPDVWVNVTVPSELSAFG